MSVWMMGARNIPVFCSVSYSNMVRYCRIRRELELESETQKKVHIPYKYSEPHQGAAQPCCELRV